ncbi:MAG: acyl-CoA dehydrogenase family protein [Acidimicrobiia bacterium]|nr:acyl-CoA dehydrogenase family protein [Acidimicrobiia bacterium]MCL4292185.1 acyl-CoA dehydrogenase family protein [Acidimicrobiia bacterium]
MFLEYTSEQQALSRELRAYFRDLMGDDVVGIVQERGENNPRFREVVRRIGRDGWLGIGWPTEYGGQGRPVTDQFIFFDEVWRAQAPFPFVTLNTVGPTLMAYGTPEQKERYLPGILTGDVVFAIGYTEPEAGTDLASLRTRAVRDGDEWVVNGNKIFTSGANHADYVWLACRTDPDAPKHKGISMIVVPTASEGFSWTPIETVAGQVTTATYYDDVRVPAGNLIGEVNQGWRLMTTQLNHERVGLAALGGLVHRLWDDVAAWAASTPSGEGGTMDDLPWVRADLARSHARLEAMKLLNWRVVSAVADGTLGPADASAVKVYGVEAQIEVCRLLLGIVGAGGGLRAGSHGAALGGLLEQAGRTVQINTFGGGVLEVLREIVAAAGLGMARSSR